MADTPDHTTDEWKVIEITGPIAGLNELYEHDRSLYVHATAEQFLGTAGRMIAGSKSDYTAELPNNVPVFNANVCTKDRGKIWFGDLDITLDEQKLVELAAALGEQIYVLYERGARFGNEDRPDFSDFAVRVARDGTVEMNKWIARADDGRLRPREVSRSD
jgi:hypothetical protein